jgi:hypothetical protein
MRLALVLALIHGLVPGLGEIAETVVHYALEGHLAHSEADQGDLGNLGHEHGCGTTEHRCGCCDSQVFAAQPAAATPGAPLSHETTAIDGWQLVSLHDPAPPRRPPIVS